MARKRKARKTTRLNQEVGATESQVDRLTSLVDTLVSNILSRLPTKTAAKTCVLSKDWRYKSPSVCDLYFDTMYQSLHGRARLIDSFNAFLTGCVQNNLPLAVSGFVILDSKAQDSHKKPTWMSRISSKRHIDNLLIETSTEHGIILRVFPRTELYLPLDRSVRIGVQNSFPNLRSLSLSGPIEITNELSLNTGELSLTFPVLENMTLTRCDFLSLKFLEFNVPELTQFLILGCEAKDYVIKILAPRLKVFESSGGHFNNFVLCAPSLDYMHLEHEDVPSKVLASRAAALLTGVPCLESLVLSYAIARALIEWREVHVLPALNRLRHFYLSQKDEDIISQEYLGFFKQPHNFNPSF